MPADCFNIQLLWTHRLILSVAITHFNFSIFY